MNLNKGIIERRGQQPGSSQDEHGANEIHVLRNKRLRRPNHPFVNSRPKYAGYPQCEGYPEPLAIDGGESATGRELQ